MNGLLLCDVPAKPVQDKYGDYSAIFNSTFKVNGGFKSFKVYQGEYPQDVNEYKVFVLTGSSSSAYEKKEWILNLIEFLQRIHSTTDIKIVGICFGFQILCLALGGQVVKNSLGWEVGPTLLNCNAQGESILKVDELKIQSMHQDIVQELPKDWINLAESDKCKSQFAIYKNRYLCVQGHPEFTRDMIQEIVNVRKHIFSGELTTIMDNLEIYVDSQRLIEIIVEFINKG